MRKVLIGIFAFSLAMAVGLFSSVSVFDKPASATTVCGSSTLCYNYPLTLNSGLNINGADPITGTALTINSGGLYVASGTSLFQNEANFLGPIAANSTFGVSCTGTPTASFATVNGIVTHC